MTDIAESTKFKPLDGVVTGNNDLSRQSFVLHPLPLLNISDYYTRAKNTKKALAGALLGWRNHTEIVAFIAFELLMTDDKVDEDYLRKKRELYLQTFPNYEFLGWFHILPNLPMHPVHLSLSIHEQISQVCDNPILVVMNPEEDHLASSELPFRAYEPIYRDMKIEFVEIPIKIETGEAERIAVDDIVKGADSSTYGLSSHLSTQNNALRIFHQRLRVVRDFMNGVKNGKFPPDYELLRRIDSFTSQLSKQTRVDLFTSLNVQELDALVASMMALVVKSERDKFDLNAKWLTLKSSRRHPA